jgi:hypothetical protein
VNKKLMVKTLINQNFIRRATVFRSDVIKLRKSTTPHADETPARPGSVFQGTFPALPPAPAQPGKPVITVLRHSFPDVGGATKGLPPEG